MPAVDGTFQRMSSISTPAAWIASLPLASDAGAPPWSRRSSQTAAPVTDGVQLFRFGRFDPVADEGGQAVVYDLLAAVCDAVR